MQVKHACGAMAAAVLASLACAAPLSAQDLPLDVPFSVVELNRAEVPEGISQTLTLSSDGNVHGNSGCNTYAAGYAASGGAIIIQPARVTRMACEPAEMKAEERFLAVLAVVTSLDYDEETGTLRLNGADGRTVMRLSREAP